MKKRICKVLAMTLALCLLVSVAPAAFATDFADKELNIAIFEGGYGPEYWQEMVAGFEAAYPGVKVNMQISPTIGDIIRPQIVGKNVPDFISMNDNDQSGVVLSLIKERGLLDITDVFDGPALGTTDTLRSKVLDGFLESTKCSPYGDGRVYLAPFNAGPMGSVYNKTLFTENGWTPPTTWDEFFALGDKAKEKGIALYTYQGIYPGYLESFLFPAIASAGGADALTKISHFEEGSFATPEVMSVLENIAKIASAGYLMEGTVALNHTQSQTDQMNNKALFIPNGTWMEGEMKDAPRAEGYAFGMTPSPVVAADQQRYIMSSIEQFSIPAEAKNPELAKEFLRFLYTEASVKSFAQKSNGVYALKGAAELVKDVVTPGVYGMFGVYEEASASPLVFGFDAVPQGCKIVVYDEIFNPIADVMNGSMTAQQWSENVEAAFAQIRDDIAAAK